MKLYLLKTMLLLCALVAGSSAWAEEVTDVLNRALTGVQDGSSSYTSWSKKSSNSDAVYAGNSAGSKGSIQLRSSNNNSGVVTTASGGKVTKITVSWENSTQSGRTLNIYGKNTAYSAATDLYNSSNQGTLLGTIVYGTSTELTVTGDYEYIGFRSASGAMYLTEVKITWETGGGSSDTPSISADNVDINYDATGGNIAYTLNNEVSGGSVSAEVTSGSDWLTLGAGTASPISFTCTANATATVRKAIVTLTYTYNTEAVTKDVTVTQAAAPVIYSTIPDLFNAATSTSTPVTVIFGNWVVSGINNNQVFVTDGTNGFIIYQSEHGFELGNTLSGTASCNLVLYNASTEITGLTSTTTGLTVGTGGTVTPVVKTIADLSAVNTGSVVTLKSLTYDGSNLSDGTNPISPHTSLFNGTFVTGKKYNVTGVFLLNSETKRILPRSADDIKEITVTSISVDASGATTVFNQNDDFSSEGIVVTATYDDNSTKVVTEYTVSEPDMSTPGTKTVTVSFGGKEDSYEITVIKSTTTNYTWDLSQASYSQASTNQVTWTSANVTMVVDKASSTTNANNYLPTTRTSTRFYTNSILTITPASGYSITSVEFTATTEGYANAFAGSTWTNATASVSSTTVTVTPADGTNALVATIGGTCGFTSVKVTYASVTTTATITLNALCTDGDMVYGTYSNSSAFVVSDDIEVSEISIVDGKLYVEAYETGAVVPANTGVMVSAIEGGDYTVTLTSEEGTSVLGEENVLRPTGEGITAAEMAAANENCVYYRLTMQGGTQIGFWWGAEDGAAFDVAANKAYLAVPNDAEGARMSFWFGGENTGVADTMLSTKNSDSVVYDLQGRRVVNATKGLYIVDGKKVMVK